MSSGKSTPENPAKRDTGQDELAEALKEAGLRTAYWLPVLDKQLGITGTQALKHLTDEDYLKLASNTEYTWEKKALKELLQAHGKAKMKQQQKECVEEKRKRQEETKAALTEVKELHLKGKDHHKEGTQKKEENWCKVLEVPMEPKHPSGKTLMEETEARHKQLEQQEESVCRSENVSDKEVLRRASGGLALQGIYRTNSLVDMLAKREQLINIPDGFKLAGPEQGSLLEKKEFSSSAAEATFTKSMEQLGYSISVAAKVGFNVEVGVDYNSSSQSEETHQSCSEQAYICTTKYQYIPLASCYFQKHQLRLSDAALRELQDIEQLLSITQEANRLNMLKSRCGSFFSRFGSHVNQGPLHFGGIFWWKASTEGFRAEQREEMKRQASEALNCYIGASYRGFSFSTAPTLNITSNKVSAQGSDRKSFEVEVHLSVTQTGGPGGVDSLKSWKNELKCSNTSWCVIDRGFQLIPVWDIILSNHGQDFRNVHQLSSSLRAAYERLTNLPVSTLCEEGTVSALGQTQSFLEEIRSWEVSGDEQQLVKLMIFKQDLNEKTKSNKIWVSTCLADKVLQDFLVKTVSLYKYSSLPNTLSIKFLLRCLLDPHIYSVDNFPKSSFIMQWVFHDEEEPPRTPCVYEFSDFLHNLQKMKDLMEEAASVHLPEVETEAKVKVSLNLSLALCSFLKALREGGETDVASLLLCIAESAGYQEENSTFQYLLELPDVSFMLSEMKKAHERYMSLRNQATPRAQAFLLLTGLSMTAKRKDMSPEQKFKCLTRMKHHIGNSLSEEVSDILRKHGRCDPGGALEKDLNSLVNGEYATSNGDLQKEVIKQELINICQGAKQKDSSKPSPSAEQSDDPKMNEGSRGQEFLHLIKQLGLENYYPRKMGMADFHIIDKTSRCDSQPRTGSEYPFYFLQKLLMLDYRVRYLVCQDDSKAKEPILSTLNATSLGTECSDDSSDIYSDFLNANTEEINASVTTGLTHIHPMDLQMAIFHCADDFMRQYLSTKLAFCQFALPLLVPNPCTSQIEFPLWSLSQIKKSWKGTEKLGKQTTIKSHKNKLIYQAETPIVSFIRIGSSPSSSKSQILNALLSKHKHDTFFHRHCKGSTKDCLLMKGVVEISWYCPSGRNDDRFENCIAFTNLHGDAREHKQQVKFVQEIASLNVVLLTTSDENEVGKQLVRDLLMSPKPFICLLTEKEGSAVSITKQNIKVSDKSNLSIKIPIKNRNEADLVDDLANTIRSLLEDAEGRCSLDTCVGTARQYGFLIDEDREDCKEAKAVAQALVAFCKEKNVASVKEKLLPLQGELWHEWCRKDKELTRLQDKRNRSIEQHRSEIESEKHAIRQKQLEKGSPPNELMKPVLKIILSDSETMKKYFLQWIKMFMDVLSADHLAELQQKYHALWSQMKEKAYSAGNGNAGDILRHKLEALSTEISASTIGLEHILREVGQIYEALDVNTQKDEHFLQLPQIAADLMVSGYPIELMDGDASYVPLRWVGAIFDKLIEKLGDKRVYVLSVLGIQSTGKSTLLNAMFGLQFNVSAGRCTRGAFMQLLKVDEKLQQDVNFDYMLIVDTEGLRAIEMANKQSLNHDNELATFVIGIGNMTLINIFGENPSEMQDVLQIAVQAFLRMKQVNLSPSCLFVHQNVGEITAKEQNMEGQRRLQEKLDEMTVTAAQQEFCDVTCFSDVIRFDVNTHIHYFAHLWEGNPPMAPPNPTYSQNVQELKSKILQAAKKEVQGSILRLSSLKVRISDLWNALLNEKFVFSFKNTLEIVAYNRLETVYSQWTWQLRSHILRLQMKLNNRIKKGEIQHVTRRSLMEEVQEKYETILKDLEQYFREDEDSGVLIQWKASIENKLKDLKEVLVDETQRKSAEFIELKKNHSKLYQKKSEYEQKLFERSQMLALSLKNEELNEEKLRQHFDLLWKQWVYEVSSSTPPPEEPNINLDIENILLEHFKQEPNIEEKIKCFLQKDAFTVDISKHVVMKGALPVMKKPLDSCDITRIEQLKDRITQLVSMTIDTKEQERMDYNQSYIHEILNEIRKQVDSAASNSKYTFTNEYRIHLSVSLCKMAAKRFENMHEAFKRANDPTFYLESKREDFFKTFQISCQGATSITAFADFVCDKLSVALRQAVYAKTAIDIACEMRSNYPAFNGNRSKLETAILISLAEEENFEKFRQYIHFPKDFLESFIENCVNNYCLDKKNRRLKKFLSISLNSFQTRIVSAIFASTQVVKDKCGNVSLWLDEFCSRLGDNFELPRSDLKSTEHQEIKDIEFLKEAMSKALAPVLENLKQEFSVTDLKPFNLKPHKILFEQLHGCWEQCPFCKALCTNTIPGHDGDHSVHFHRPQALNGTQWIRTNQFVIEICSSLVASNCFLVLDDNSEISYKNYRKAGPAYANWSITPDSSTQAYWKWFVCHFRSQLEQDYHAKFEGKGSIPPEWEKFTKKDVICELKQLSPQHSISQHKTVC
ncbi:interferon-induced very large GTPase 1-like [Apteryx mantelli]|uniref:Interferon-induced very large GTPase 1-like n=1 Tax=Apteryx mantelli TaxID=2696672 RepID=A0ABM4ED11_9AVES